MLDVLIVAQPLARRNDRGSSTTEGAHMPFSTQDEAVRQLRRIFPPPPWITIAATDVSGITGPPGGTWLIDSDTHTDQRSVWAEFRRHAPRGKWLIWVTTAGNPLAPVVIIDSDLLDRAFGAKEVV